MSSAIRTTLILLAVFAAPALAQQPVLVRLRDAVGDTIDLAERDSFHLFPNSTRFRKAVLLALPGPEFFAEVTRTGADSASPIYLRIMPTDLERIRFLIDNHVSVAQQRQSDSTYARALVSFWKDIEVRPLRNMASEPLIAEKARVAPTEAMNTGEPVVAESILRVPTEAMASIERPATSENRYSYTLHGATLGSIAGGLVGSKIGIGGVASIALAAAGSYAGYQYGDGLDRKSGAVRPLPREGQGWRVCCAAGACVPGLALGVLTAALAGSVADRRSLGWVPAALSGVCVTVEVITLGYRLGRSIDRGIP